MFTILHLSDLHFKKPKSEDRPAFRREIRSKMLAAVREHLEKIDPTLDFVVITGDIAYDGKDYNEAEPFFGELKAILPETAVWLPVPGNHDLDRGRVKRIFSIQKNVVEAGEIESFLEDGESIAGWITGKFQAFREFAVKMNPGLYPSADDYFWVQDFNDQQVSFLGLNSAWASEGDHDQMKIALGLPQVQKALERAKMPNRILLLHHPPFDWLEDRDMEQCRIEIAKTCQLLLHGHVHKDKLWSLPEPDHSCLCLGANASYTSKDGYPGFQFLRVDFGTGETKVRVWPYRFFEESSREFQPDRTRYEKAQQGRGYFELVNRTIFTSAAVSGTVPVLPIPRDYRDWMREFHSIISFDQLAKNLEAPPVQLLSIYIPLETRNPFYQPDQEKLVKDKKYQPAQTDEVAATDEAKETATIDIEELVGRVECVLIRGNAGMGKTTLIKHLANAVIQGKGPATLSGYLPVLIFFKDLWQVYLEERHTGPRKLTFEQLLPLYLKKIKCPLSWELILNYLSREKALFLFDGLDEIPEAIRANLVELIAEFRFGYRQNRFLLTGRPHGVAGKAQDRFGDAHEIEDLDETKVREFIQKWFRAICVQATGTAKSKARDLNADLAVHEHISIFTRNPLLLTAVCILYLANKRIPEQRADLYNRIIENILYQHFHGVLQPQEEERLAEYFMALAFFMQENNWKTIEENEAKKVLTGIISRTGEESEEAYRRRINRLFAEIEPNCGLLNRLTSGEIEFFHLTFQEFLAAKRMVDLDENYRKYTEKDWWGETLLLYAGFINLTEKKRSNEIVKELLNWDAQDEKSGHRCRLLGAKALRDFQAAKRDEEALVMAREKLVQLINSGAGLSERFEAGELLGIFGDPRLREETMVKVPGGEFLRGSNDWDESQPVKKIYLDDYYIGKYLVTNQEFKEFVDAGGYHDRELWSEEGWKWRESEKISEPRYWNDRKWDGPNFPIVGVCWYEAEAYAKWLSAEKGEKYRLPTEAEWEKAARGTDGRKYPWGNQWENEYCNCEGILGRTSPVGIFLSGESPYGCLDMAGNVWEWCADWYNNSYYKKNPPKNPTGPDHGSYRVIRGGSWFNDAVACAAAYRRYDHPVGRDGALGFRLVRS
jgi:formylglycine-generating enzyme required for sulfatase activity/predicted MPP superfamily phosphohydrolase